MTRHERIMYLKKRWAYTYQVMSDMCGINKDRIGRIARGTTRPYAEDIQTIANLCFNMHSSQLLSRVPENIDGSYIEESVIYQGIRTVKGQRVRVVVENI